MKEEEAMDEKFDKETINLEKKSFTESLKKMTKTLIVHNCKECSTRENAVFKVAAVGGKVALGVGVGVCVGVGALATAAVAEIAIPAILTFKALALTGGMLGFVKGANDFNKK